VLELHPDIVAFQEVWVEETARPMIQAFQAEGYEVIDSPTRSNLKQSGLLTFVRTTSGWAIDARRYEPYWDRAPVHKVWEGDGLARKGLHIARLRQGDKPLVIVNTHLQARYRNGYETIRSRQLKQLLGAADVCAVEGVPVLVSGDLNTEPSERLYELFSNDSWIDLTQMYRQRRGECSTSMAAGGPNGWIDYILARCDPSLRISADIHLEENGGKDDPYSDHHGLLATVYIEQIPKRVRERLVEAPHIEIPARRVRRKSITAAGISRAFGMNRLF
jgi:endonuclease/exonuclease/phosphatase family metal-dependent hydrolase